MFELKINACLLGTRETRLFNISAMSFQNPPFLWTPFLHPTLPPRSSWSGNFPMNPTGTSPTTWSSASASLKPVSFTSLTTVRKVSHALVSALSADPRTELIKLIIQPPPGARQQTSPLNYLWNDHLRRSCESCAAALISRSAPGRISWAKMFCVCGVNQLNESLFAWQKRTASLMWVFFPLLARVQWPLCEMTHCLGICYS